jgi:uncharacterized phage-associated protein
MAKAFDVARRLIRLAANEEEPDFLTHLRLQKLLYYVQGWALALRGKPMFDEEIQAWAHGPVVPKVYSRFAEWEKAPIDPGKYDDAELSNGESKLVAEVWESYKGYSAASLRAMTHREPPWLEARRDCKPADKCETAISQKAMRKYFTKLAKS